jgi:hypothetical protein
MNFSLALQNLDATTPISKSSAPCPAQPVLTNTDKGLIAVGVVLGVVLAGQLAFVHYEKQEGFKGTLVLEHDPSIHGFYHETLSLFQSSLKHRGWCNRCLIGETKFKAEHCLSLLYIWAQGLDLLHFERRIDTDFGLQELVAGSLTSIARIVLSGKLMFLSLHHCSQSLTGAKTCSSEIPSSLITRAIMLINTRGGWQSSLLNTPDLLLTLRTGSRTQKVR